MMCDLISENFFKNGFVSIDLNKEIIQSCNLSLNKRIANLTGVNVKGKDFSNYHNWNKDDKIFNHSKICNKNARHFIDNNLVNSVIKQESVHNICKILFEGQFKVWDEGLGNIAYRLIRPFGDDGYPLSKKTWGPGGYLLSISIPISCADPRSGIGLVPQSHNKDYNSKKDTSGKFEEKELRFSGEINKLNIIRPMKTGSMLLIHPELLHCESVASNCTHSRLSLEIRIHGMSNV